MLRAAALVLLALLVVAPAARAQADAPAVDDEAEQEKRPHVLVLDLEAIDVDVEKMKIINGTVVDVLSGYESLEIVSQADIRQMVDFEAEKQAMGCNANSCLAEIAGAMGAGYVVFGRVGRLDDVLFVQLNLFDSAKARAVAREEVRAQKLSQLPDLIRPALGKLVRSLTGESAPPQLASAPAATTMTPTATASEGGLLSSPLLWAGGVLAGLGLAGGAALALGTVWAETTLGTVGAPVGDKDTALLVGPFLFFGAIGGAAIGAGGVALVGAAVVLE